MGDFDVVVWANPSTVLYLTRSEQTGQASPSVFLAVPVTRIHRAHPEQKGWTVNSKERVLTAVAHKEPDRVPLDFYATPEVWKNLKAYFGVRDDEAVLRNLQVDFRGVLPVYAGPTLRRFPDGTQENSLGGSGEAHSE